MQKVTGNVLYVNPSHWQSKGWKGELRYLGKGESEIVMRST